MQATTTNVVQKLPQPMNTTLIQYPEKFFTKLANYCLKSYQGLAEDPRVFLMRKLARFEILRNWAAMLSKRPTKSLELGREKSSILGNLDVDTIATTIETESCYQGFQLPQDAVLEIWKFANSTVGYINRDLNRPCRYQGIEPVNTNLPKDARVFSYMSNSMRSSTLQRLIKDPGILAIAAKFLGAPPVHMGSEISWSLPVPGNFVEQRNAAQVFHYDLDDYRFIKFFFYLTDVDLASGPHTYIRGTHKGKKLLHQLIGTRCASIPDEKILECYDAKNMVNVCGKAGFGFVENALCFHRGSQPTEKPRLMLQIEYSMNDYGNIHEMLGY